MIISAAVLLSACDGAEEAASSQSGKAQNPKISGHFYLPYSVGDSLNPYAAKSKANQELCLLMFEPLIRLDDTYTPQNALADTVNVEGKLCVITLKSAVFSDGSPVTAADVSASKTLASASATKYAAQLKDITVTVSEESKLTFTSKEPMPDMLNLLDFPIIKSGTDKRQDSDKTALPPIGCGRYVFNEESRDRLDVNQGYSCGAVPLVDKVELVNTPDSASMKHNVEVGSISMYYEENGTSGLKGNSAKVPLNNIVYIGVNHARPALADVNMRVLLSSALSRQDIVSNVYMDYAAAAFGPFNPVIKDSVPATAPFSPKAKAEETIAKLAELGYNSKDNDGYYLKNEKRLSLKLLVNSENQLKLNAAKEIIKQLKACGIEIVEDAKTFNQYTSALASGSYDLFLAEVKLQNNNSLKPLLSGGETSNGTPDVEVPGPEPQLLSAAYTAYLSSGDKAVFGDAFNASLPFIPVLYRFGSLGYSGSITGSCAPSISDIFYSISGMEVFH